MVSSVANRKGRPGVWDVIRAKVEADEEREAREAAEAAVLDAEDRVLCAEAVAERRVQAEIAGIRKAREALAPGEAVVTPEARKIIDAEEAAGELGITVKALYQRVSRHQVPHAALYRTGTPGKRQRLQFVRDELLKARRSR